MAPNIEFFSTPLEGQMKRDVNPDKVKRTENWPPPSTYPGIWKYPTNRDASFRAADDWMNSKRIDDDIDGLWRVHDKIYNLEAFITKHPGGSDWIDMSRGTDITEAFEASHIVNFSRVEKVLEKYYVKDATSPRISPFTLKEDGFYKTLKRRVEPILKEVGTGPKTSMKLFQDSVVLGVITFAVLGTIYNSILFAVISGILLGFSTIGGHNFFHQKENWRRYYFDLSLCSSYEWRITHSFSHHLYVNTVMDFEMSIVPTYEYSPNRPKHWFQRHFSIFYSHIIHTIAFWFDLGKRIYHISKGQQKLRVENFLPFVELAALIYIQNEPWVGLKTWIIVHSVSSYVLTTIGQTVSHHHPTCFHDGDEPLQDPDFGIGQLDATKDRAENIFNNIFLTLISFGHHPLHHLFPTVCHSKLPYIREVFEQTAAEFKLDYPGVPQLEIALGLYLQLARTEPFKRKKAD